MADRFFNIVPIIYTLAAKNLTEFVLSSSRMERNANLSQCLHQNITFLQMFDT